MCLSPPDTPYLMLKILLYCPIWLDGSSMGPLSRGSSSIYGVR